MKLLAISTFAVAKLNTEAQICLQIVGSPVLTSPSGSLNRNCLTSWLSIRESTNVSETKPEAGNVVLVPILSLIGVTGSDLRYEE